MPWAPNKIKNNAGREFFSQNEEMFMLRKRYFIIVGKGGNYIYFLSGFTTETTPLCTFLEIVLQYFMFIGK